MAKIDIEQKTLTNKAYRKVLVTTKQMQLVVMNLPILEDIPEEVHKVTTQFIKVEKGNALVIVSGKNYKLTDGDSIMIPANTKHYVKNIGNANLLLYNIYSPPEHPDKLIQKKKPKDK
jgi:mannose-6-phosphate isomerase-like protein (cupin superfamily)